VGRGCKQNLRREEVQCKVCGLNNNKGRITLLFSTDYVYISAIQIDQHPEPRSKVPDQASVKKVHVIFKTHFDFGFTDFAQAVQDQYFDTFIPQVLDQARQLREAGAAERYVWTTGSWLIYNYLEASSQKERQRMEAAIEAGDITWHALPFTFHSEMADASLFQHGLNLSQTLDNRFGRTTISAKMTDVPGHTRGIISLLADVGVEFLHIGVNEAATPPDVPPLFIWRDINGAEIVVMYQHAYGADIQIPGLHDALAFGFTEDNVGPQSIDDIHTLYRSLAQSYPSADIQASTLDQFALALRTVRSELPVVTDEIGDTWIHGAGTDPYKVSRYRALSRLRRQWLSRTTDKPNAAALHAFSQHLMCVPEHTWGLDEKLHLDDYSNYAGIAFEKARTLAPFKKMEASWAEQRAYIESAIQALDNTPYRKEAEDLLEGLKPQRIAQTPEDTLQNPTHSFKTRHFDVSIDSQSGGIIHLKNGAQNRNWASVEAPICVLTYQTFSEVDYDRYMDEYLSSRPEWGILDNSKPGIEKAGAISKTWTPTLTRLRKRTDPHTDVYILDLEGDEEAVERFGCPRSFTLVYRFPHECPQLDIEVQWFDKPATRLPEAIWCAFVFPDTNPSGWRMEKMGQSVSPLRVVSKGNRSLHAIDTGLQYADTGVQLYLDSPDAALVAPGTPAPLRFENKQPNLSKGWHFNLYNNLWGTNFPMWYEEDARFRFSLRFERG